MQHWEQLVPRGLNRPDTAGHKHRQPSDNFSSSFLSCTRIKNDYDSKELQPMTTHSPPPVPWQFLSAWIPQLLQTYAISFDKENTCIEYYISNRKRRQVISRQLTLSHELFSGNLYVSKFYPEIYKEINCLGIPHCVLV